MEDVLEYKYNEYIYSQFPRKRGFYKLIVDSFMNGSYKKLVIRFDDQNDCYYCRSAITTIIERMATDVYTDKFIETKSLKQAAESKQKFIDSLKIEKHTMSVVVKKI